jgi:hypothetical protein
MDLGEKLVVVVAACHSMEARVCCLYVPKVVKSTHFRGLNQSLQHA